MSVRSEMSYKRKSLIAAQTLAVLALFAIGSAACKKSPAPAPSPAAEKAEKRAAPNEPVVAYIGDSYITASEVQKRLNEQSRFVRGRQQDLRSRLAFVDNLVRQELIAQEAYRRGLDKEPEVEAAIKRTLVQEMFRRGFGEDVREYTEEELKEHYDKHIDFFVKPERIRVLHVFLQAPEQNKAARAEGRKKANQLLATIKTAEASAGRGGNSSAFGDIAREHSDDISSKGVGGDLIFRSFDQLENLYGTAFAKAVFAMKEQGEISGVIETPRGFHIAKLISRQAAQDRKFDDAGVQKMISERITRERRTGAYDQLIKRLREESGVRIDEEVLAAIEVDASGPPAAVGAPVERPVAETK